MAMRPPNTNNLFLFTVATPGNRTSHFRLSEFENSQGWAMVHPSVLRSLELTRATLCTMCNEEVFVIITSATRTKDENDKLAQSRGWTTEGGAVALESKHLPEYGGIAVDIIAKKAATGALVPQSTVFAAAQIHFDVALAHYPDGHVHADNRARALPPPRPGA